MAHHIVKNIPDAYFLMVGNGEMENEVRAYAEENWLRKDNYSEGILIPHMEQIPGYKM